MLNLANRAESLRELMDDPECDLEQLHQTYRHFALLNRVLSGWDRIYTRFVRPTLVDKEKRYRLLDIGFGGGDIPMRLLQLARRDGFCLEVTAIDTDLRALEYVRRQDWPQDLIFSSESASSLRQRGEQFDFVISNHLLHHLGEQDVVELLDDSEALCRGRVLFGDIRRSAGAYASYAVFSCVLRSSFARKDGLLSIRRSFTEDELRKVVPESWRVVRMFPWRLLLVHES